VRLRTTFLWTMIVSLALAAALGILVILFDGLGETGARILGTSLLVGGFSLICLACAIVIDRRRAPIVMWVGLGTSLAALAVWVLTVWSEPLRIGSGGFDTLIKIGTTLTVACCWAAHFGILLLLPVQRREWRILRTATFVTTGLLGVAIVVTAWGEIDKEWMFKVIAVLSILGSCGTVVTPILALIERIQRRGEPVTIQRSLRLTLTCPRCGRDQQVLVGRSKCQECGLQFRIEVEEPHCTCGYPIYKVEGDRCPECGRAIPVDQRWPNASRDSTAAEAAAGG
jgi:transcription elongation factor Elf1